MRSAAYLSMTAGIAMTVLGVLLVRRRLAIVEVDGPSMLPTLTTGDRVLVRRAKMDDLRAGLVVVVDKPRPDGGWAGPPPSWPPRQQEWLIKRVAALPGDRRPADVPSPDSEPDNAVVPREMFVVLGDNAARSYDSRMMGCIPAERLLGIMIRPLCTKGTATAAPQPD
jgi:signal peptidase I